MKQILLFIVLSMSFSLFADPSIFESREMPGPARGTALCSGKQLSRLGAQMMSSAVDSFVAEMSVRAYVPAGATEAQRWFATRGLIAQGIEGPFMINHVYPRAKQILGELYFKNHGFYQVRIASVAAASNTFAQFKVLTLASFGQINCNSLHYRGLGEALHDQFGL